MDDIEAICYVQSIWCNRKLNKDLKSPGNWSLESLAQSHCPAWQRFLWIFFSEKKKKETSARSCLIFCPACVSWRHLTPNDFEIWTVHTFGRENTRPGRGFFFSVLFRGENFKKLLPHRVQSHMCRGVSRIGFLQVRACAAVPLLFAPTQTIASPFKTVLYSAMFNVPERQPLYLQCMCSSSGLLFLYSIMTAVNH